MLMTHGVYGTNPEIDGIKYIYFLLFDQKHGTAYVRLSDMNFGSAATHGLKWMTLDACNSLFTNNITSMANAGKLPDNGTLHLMLGYSSTAYGNPRIQLYYASNLVSSVSIWGAWQDGNIKALAKCFAENPTGMTNKVTVRVMGLNSCINDTIYTFNDPDLNTPYEIFDVPVFTP